MLLTILLYPEYLEDPEDTDHDESVFVSVMCTHKISDLASEIHNENEKKEYTDHECLAVGTCPIREYRVICSEIFRLEYSESSHHEYEEHRENTRFRYAIDHIDRDGFAESLLEHIQCREEDDKKPNPLYTRILD